MKGVNCIQACCSRRRFAVLVSLAFVLASSSEYIDVKKWKTKAAFSTGQILKVLLDLMAPS